MTTMTTDPRLTVPRRVGVWRPASRIRPGWWVHCEPLEADTVAGEWAQVRAVLSGTARDASGATRRAVQLMFTQALSDDDGNAITVLASSEAVTLTEREAKWHGLTPEVAP